MRPLRLCLFGSFILLVIASSAQALCSSPFCAMCNFIRQNGYTAWQQYLAGRWRNPESVEVQATPDEAIDMMLAGLNLKPDDVLYDIGCGDGRVLIRAVQKYGCLGVGIEIDAAVAEIARQKVEQAGCGRIRIVTGDARKFLFHGADAVVMYLLPDLVEELAPKITVDRVASYMHPVPGRECRDLRLDKGTVYFAVGKKEPIAHTSRSDWLVLNKGNE